MKQVFLLASLMFIPLLLQAYTRSGSVQSSQHSNQTTPNKPHNGFKKENLRFGGNFHLEAGNITRIDISPTIGYQFTKMLQAGVGAV